MSEHGWDKDAVHRRKLHEGYILFILLSVLIGVLTVKWSDVPKLTEYLSFALTLASLLLAVMAIGYAIYSNQGLETNLASLVSSITDVKEIASSLSTSSSVLSTDLRSLSERTGGIDKRVNEIAENTRIQDQKKQTVISPERESASISSGFDLKNFALVTSTNGRYVLFALTIALLNNKAINMRELFQRTGMPTDYNHGFLIAISSAEIYKGRSAIDNVEVRSFEGADEKFLTYLIDATLAGAGRSKIKSMKEMTTADLGKLRTYLEDQEFNHFGSLEPFARLPIADSVSKGA